MEKTTFETILRIFDLDECRSFYLELFGQDALAVNSSFLVRFKLTGHKYLSLEKTSGKIIPKTISLDIADPIGMLQKLRVLEAPMEEVPCNSPSCLSIRSSDPEGNQLLIQCPEAVFANFSRDCKTKQDFTRI